MTATVDAIIAATMTTPFEIRGVHGWRIVTRVVQNRSSGPITFWGEDSFPILRKWPSSPVIVRPHKD